LSLAFWRIHVAHRRRHLCQPRRPFRIKRYRPHKLRRVPGCPAKPASDPHQCRLPGSVPRRVQVSGRGLALPDKDSPECLAARRSRDRWGTRIPQAGTCALRNCHRCYATRPSIFPASRMQLRIDHAQPSDAPIIAQMVGELLREIMAMVGTGSFGFRQKETETRARSWMTNGMYSVLLARDTAQPEPLGLLALYESYALYSEGTTARFQNSMFASRIDHKGSGLPCSWRQKELGD
jgi:hypothetical protein